MANPPASPDLRPRTGCLDHVTSGADLMTLPVGLGTVKSAYGLQYAQNMATSILAAVPLVLVFLFFQRQIIKGIATSGFGGQ